MVEIDKKQIVQKKVLDNGFTIVVYPLDTVAKVSIQLWYNVGSKDEKNGERGLAHFLEHMLFKGTCFMSEPDIDLITKKLSGYCNAFTSYDYTAYLFDMPAQHWHYALPMLADCMRNCTFKQDHLNSEVKAVIQELKMYRDDYAYTLLDEMISAIFPDHPYHHPIIGYKQNLMHLNRETMVNFYKHHYVPNNATLIVVGAVNSQEVFALAQECFGGMPAAKEYRKQEFYRNEDFVSRSITLYREVENPMAILAWVIPGTKARKDYLIDIVGWVLGQDKGSRLYKKLVDDLCLVTDLRLSVHSFFDYGLLTIEVDLKDADDLEKIKQIINDEILSLIQQGFSAKELQRARKKTEMDYLGLFENTQRLASTLGECMLAFDDEKYVFGYLDYPQQNLETEVKEFLARYLRPIAMHTGLLLTIGETEKAEWQELQELSDKEDAEILAGKERTSQVEKGVLVETITPTNPIKKPFPAAQKYTLKNGLEVLYYHSQTVKTIELILELKAKYYFDPEDLQGLSSFGSALLSEGTNHYTGHEFALELESYGMSFVGEPGCMVMSMLSGDLPKAVEMLYDVLTNARFAPDDIEKVRAQMLTEIDAYWDEPTQFVMQLVRDIIYKDHPYSKNALGSIESVEKITRKDLMGWYHSSITPKGARLVLVGDITQYDIPALLESMLGNWQGPEVIEPEYPVLQEPKAQTITYPINRDQVVLCFAAPSITRMDSHFDELLIFDQIFTGGVLGGMSSRLFALREQSGLFYTITGSLFAYADSQPGMVLIKTIVSPDRLQEAQEKILQVVADTTKGLTDQEILTAKHALINSLVDGFSTQYQIASSLLFQARYHLSDDYFDTRAQAVMAIPREAIEKEVNKILRPDDLICIRIGRAG